MKINFKKVSAIAASALMMGMTVMGGVAAANYPLPFVKGGVADVAIVYGTGASYLDVVQAGNIQSNLQSYMGASDGSTTVSGDSWQVGTSSDALEIGESIRDVYSYIGKSEFSLLSDESISNEKGDATYSQYFYFEDTRSSMVNYTEDDDDNVGLFLLFKSGNVIARYVMDFSTDLKSDIETDMELSDIEDKEITFLGKKYTVTQADNGSSGIELTLMSGALGGTISEGTPLTMNGYTVEVIVSSSTAAQFTITSASGTETTDKMNKGEITKLNDGNYLAVTDITYEGYAEGDQSATIYIGADKIEWKNGTSMTVNGDTISDAAVLITHTESGKDVSISEIAINMTAEDDLYIPAGKRLSEASDLDEPEVLVSQNWDIQYAGLEAIDYEDLSLKVSGNGKKYTLKWQNYNGDEVSLPLTWSNSTGIFGGYDADRTFSLCANGTPATNITEKDYFLLNTADPILSTSDAKTILVQYKGADATSDTSPKVRFLINPGAAEYDESVDISKTAGTFTLKVAGGTFTFVNRSATTTNDYDIALTSADHCSITDTGATASSVSNYIRTYYNTLVNISDTNQSQFLLGNDTAGVGNEESVGSNWVINVTVDDGNRDGDDFTLPDNGQVFYAALRNSSSDATDASLTYTGTNRWLTDPEDSTVQRYVTRYGAEITSTDPTDDPASIEVKIPKSIVKPLVYVTTAEGVTVTSTAGGATQLGEVLVTDSEVSSVSSKNLIVVGGSCINSVAANLLGGLACGSDFTTKTGVGSGQYLIQSLTSTYSSSKIALVVAGYEAADTVNAATTLRTQAIDTTVGKKYTGTLANQATLVTTTA